MRRRRIWSGIRVADTGVKPFPLQRHPAAPDLAARRPARRRGLRVRRLARRGRSVVVAGPAARPAGRRRLAVQVRLRVRRLERAARGARRPRSSPRSSRRSSRGSRTGSPTGPRSPAATRSPTRCASSASGARCASTRAQRGVAADRRPPDLRRRRERRPRLAPSSSSRPSAVAGVAAGRVHERRPALGQPALRLAGAPRGRLPLVDRALPPHVRARRPDARRPLPRLRRLLGRPGRRGDGADRGSGAAAPGRELFDARARGARRPARDRRGPRRDHRRRSSACATSSACPGMHVLQWAFSDRPASPHRLENHRENGVVYTGTHDNDTTAGWWSSLSAARARSDRARPGATRRGR